MGQIACSFAHPPSAWRSCFLPTASRQSPEVKKGFKQTTAEGRKTTQGLAWFVFYFNPISPIGLEQHCSNWSRCFLCFLEMLWFNYSNVFPIVRTRPTETGAATAPFSVPL